MKNLDNDYVLAALIEARDTAKSKVTSYGGVITDYQRFISDKQSEIRNTEDGIRRYVTLRQAEEDRLTSLNRAIAARQ